MQMSVYISLSRFSSAPHSGWKEKSGYKYFKVVTPEQNPRQETDKERQWETLDMADKVKLHKQLRSEGHSTSMVSIFVSIFQTMPVNLSGFNLARGSLVPRPLPDFILQLLIQLEMSVLKNVVRLEGELLACYSIWYDADPCGWGDACRGKITHGSLHCGTTALQ